MYIITLVTPIVVKVGEEGIATEAVNAITVSDYRLADGYVWLGRPDEDKGVIPASNVFGIVKSNQEVICTTDGPYGNSIEVERIES